ncbi:uncharacterized protein LOC131018659 [Salvia miltiorrhiza]|uniref:uncharacterized protein LOC131018659 n=1 Tax=Salvia miltiorrhiza TaxID=226208 RepID=UPI0025ACE615|nr:uncharacterized protein LOC131018659 [Salvia miltiorrhiza]
MLRYYLMDRSWTNDKNRFSKTYIEGVESFLDFAKENVNRSDDLLRSPCRCCLNTRFKTFEEVKRHLHLNGFSNSYTKWIYHGDKVSTFGDSESNEDDDNLIDNEANESNEDIYDMLCELGEREPECFTKLFENASIKLYHGGKVSLLSVVIKLMHIKVKNKWSNKSFDMLLLLLKDILPEGNTLPSSFYGAKKVLDEMELGYQEIEVCKHDCALFYKENENEEKCLVCSEPRWKFTKGKGGKTPHKILRHFPLKSRLQKLFLFSKTSSNMRWHKDKRKDEEGVMRHPADSRAWKHFDEKFPQFAQDPRNVRLGLAADGFTPWSNLGSSYSMWPVILIAYNLPAFMFMKEEFLMMSLLIPGPSSPGKDIDVYLRPLIDELKDLWDNGIQTYDSFSKEIFQMHAALMWTISDFPGYGSLSGWVTMGKMACPCCVNQTRSEQLRSKTGFVGHRCFLPKNHAWRKNRTSFNGKEEHRLKPKHLSGSDVLFWLDGLLDKFGKPGKHHLNRKRKRNGNQDNQANWVKKSIFFELPYWCHLLIRHVLDVMHIEKNICDNILGTLLDINGKTKDNEKAREDLRDWGIREELHMKVRGIDNKPVKPMACYTLSSTEKEKFLEFLKSVKLPDGYAANISRCVKEKKLTGLKSHDCHILLQRLIPAGIRGYLNRDVSDALCELGEFFRELCSKTLRIKDVERLEKNIPLILCKLEKIFPPAFFTVMVHLAVHLPREALIAGPVHHRWMYPIERNLGSLKRLVRNKARPEGSIAEAYIVKESLNFISMYLMGIETRSNQRTRNYDGPPCGEVEDLSIFSMRARPFGHDRSRVVKSGPSISDQELEKAHHFILCNCEEVESYMKTYKAEIRGVALKKVDEFELTNLELKQFSQWLKNHINSLRSKTTSEVTEGLWALANGPFRLDTKCYTGSKKTKQVDKHFISVNIGSRWYKEDPFVLPINVKQVFYVNDTKLGKNWQIVQRVQHRHLWDLPRVEPEDTNVNSSHLQHPLQQFESDGVQEVVENEYVSGKLVRDDLEPVEVDELLFHKIRNDNKSRNEEEDDIDEEVELEYSENLTLGVGEVDYDYVSTDEDGESEHLSESDAEDLDI